MQSAPDVLNGRYKLLRRAGSGGMATVFKGQDLLLGRIVAVKVLHESLVGDSDFLRRFQKEAHSAANLAHPNIVTVHDVGQDGSRYYIVMEYVDGRTLKEVIGRQLEENGRPLGVNRALDLAIQICAGVGYAHRAGLIHCDVKPQNVIVTSDERVKVTDFGIAQALSETSIHDDVVWGTPHYFSPEQAAGQPATQASDVYAIGVILFEMLTGRLPFEADSHAALALKHMHERPPAITELNPAAPPQLARIVTKILAKEPAGRYRTAEQLGRVLESFRHASAQDTGAHAVPRPVAASMAELATVTAGPEPADIPFYPGRTGGTILRPPQPALTSRRPVEPEELFLAAPVDAAGTDWTAIALGLLALVSILGLIPLWYLVYLRYVG
jgi:serine/threonine-protein kinase